MTNNFHIADKIGFMAGTALLASLVGCVSEPSNQSTVYRGRPPMQSRTMVVYQDDYDYYPGYEVYYGRNRREFVYRDGNAWVRRPAPQGVTVDVLFASASVRMAFQDPPEQHHSTVIRSYPRNWAPPGMNRGNQPTIVRSTQREAYPERPVVQAQRTVVQAPVTVVTREAYDYYPGYEVYYNRTRREYVSRDGSAWVRQPAPRGVTVSVLAASPSVPLELQGPPEQQHSTVVKSYPKNWKHGDKKHDDKDERREDKNDHRR
ncbi:MAG: hypothetical protein Q7S40_27350 [Opitutaceae bacterium]|nr:hypothetical protein [Opitutaceae bacterium]